MDDQDQRLSGFVRLDPQLLWLFDGQEFTKLVPKLLLDPINLCLNVSYLRFQFGAVPIHRSCRCGVSWPKKPWMATVAASGPAIDLILGDAPHGIWTRKTKPIPPPGSGLGRVRRFSAADNHTENRSSFTI